MSRKRNKFKEIVLFSTVLLCMGCQRLSSLTTDSSNASSSSSLKLPASPIKIKLIQESKAVELTATLADNKTTSAFLAFLPMTVEMQEMPHEKFYYLSSALPTQPYFPQTIEAGDIMLYGQQCIVLFYETFQSAYAYTRIGKIDQIEQLSSFFCEGSLHIRFEKM